MFFREHSTTINLRNSQNGQWENYDVINKTFRKAGLQVFQKILDHNLHMDAEFQFLEQHSMT